LSGRVFRLKFILSISTLLKTDFNQRAKDRLKSRPNDLFANSLDARGDIFDKQLNSLPTQNDIELPFRDEKP